MKVYVINSSVDKDRAKFSTCLANRLKEKGKTLLISTKRSESNIEDFYGKDGMITYDLADYFTDLASFGDVCVKEDDKLNFIIAPLISNKHDITKEDIEKLTKEGDYKYIVFDKLDLALIQDKKSVFIVEENKIPATIKEDDFFLNGVGADFDVRLFKEKIESIGKNFLGEVKLGDGFDKIIDNLLNDNYVAVPNLSFFEKLKMKFSKWQTLYL